MSIEKESGLGWAAVIIALVIALVRSAPSWLLFSFIIWLAAGMILVLLAIWYGFSGVRAIQQNGQLRNNVPSS